MSQYKEALKKQGYFVIRNALSPQEVQTYKTELEKLSGITKQGFSDQHPLKTLFEKTDKKYGWAEPDGVVKHRHLWPILWNEKVLSILNTLFKKPVHFLHHNDLHVGVSASGWHRDSVDRIFGKGKEWDESNEKYELLRVGYYLQSYEESKFALGVLPGTHQYEPKRTIIERFLPSKLGKFGRLLVAIRFLLIGQNLISHKADWFKPNPGDAIVFDPRLLHNGKYPRGPKYSIFIGYGVPSSFYDAHTQFYEGTRKDLNYSVLEGDLKQELQSRNLL